MRIACWRTPGWVAVRDLLIWFRHPPSAETPGWGVAYRRNTDTGEVETELWLWAEVVAPEPGEGPEAPRSDA